ncbi:hypothetical protein SARC_03633 [Sphaeroforma arctica JP610]|uniref:Uncharacterized protein n=1 Tax=Sphaeroforma arctica JP610 TaxID=667725 RepID=A0A0L0G5D9_9EUKA|nr:hypothetical protein SARC_03633 [Sphaeroforma arctica JP610]KNC84134.1 hypothetical protein SARC_03633 [Sphaeroforma arctica JP610]|eukprot:XP_014158036.1 hypothetical protein SARC_03633 [Sphaeroforma arctica JP610]
MPPPFNAFSDRPIAVGGLRDRRALARQSESTQDFSKDISSERNHGGKRVTVRGVDRAQARRRSLLTSCASGVAVPRVVREDQPSELFVSSVVS